MYLSISQLSEFVKKMQIEEKSPRTQEKYIRDVRAFYSFAGDKAITKDLLVAWKQHLAEKKHTPASINSMIASLNSFLSFLGLEAIKLKSLRIQRETYCTESKELSKEEYLRLLQASKKQRRLHLVIQTICSTGIRVSELQYFTVEAVYKSEVVIWCKNKIRRILIPSKLKSELLNYAKSMGIRKGKIFITKNGKAIDRSNIWSAMKSLCKLANVNSEKVFPHNLRKLFARSFYKNEKDIAKLADILGHSSIDTTRIYIITSGYEHRKKIERLGLII